MANQTLVAVPPSVEDPVVLQRFLSRLVEELDIVLGFRGDEGYASAKDIVTALTELSKRTGALEEDAQTVKDYIKQQAIVLDDLFDRILEISWLKAFALKFEGRADNGPVTMFEDYNIATGERVAEGVYEFTLAQTTFSGTNILGSLSPMISWTIEPTLLTEFFTVEVQTEGLPVGTARIFINAIVQGAGNKLDVVPFDPVSAGDRISCGGALNIEGDLPPL